MQFETDEFGLLRPVTPYRYGSPPPGFSKPLRKQLGKKWVLPPRRRRVLAGDPVPTDLSPWDLANLNLHVNGRKDESVRVLVGVAILRKFGLVDRDAIVSYKGAEFQQGDGSRDYPAAHRFPCSPTIAYWDLPHHAPSRGLKNALKLPLERTDYLPRLVNYADRLFESNGACDAVVWAIRFVLHEQVKDKDVPLNLIRHVALNELFRKYSEALEKARSKVGAIQAIDPAVLAHVNQTWVSPSDEEGEELADSREVVCFALDWALDASAEPAMLAPPAMTEYISELEALHKAG